MKTQGIHEKLEWLIKLAPVIQESIPGDVMVGITDTEKFLGYISGKEMRLGGDPTGKPLMEGDAIYTAVKTKKSQFIQVPTEVFGIPFKATGIPIFDDNGSLIGGLGIGMSMKNQEKLTYMAQQFASTSEEISASSEELSSSAQDLARYMENLIRAQQEMAEQVSKTEKILGFINSIAKSSRILGLNAGIEAARSGEHGKGFSVVAREITKLADSSAKSVDEIQELLLSLKEKVDYIAEAVKTTTEISQQQTAATEEISAAINEMAVSAEDMEEFSRNI